MNEDSITRIYCDVDDFCKALEGYCKSRLLPHDKAPKWFPASALSLSGGDDHHRAVPFVRVSLFQVVLPKACARSYAGVFPPSGQLQPVCGTDGLRLAVPFVVYAGIQAGKADGHQFYRLYPLKSMP